MRVEHNGMALWFGTSDTPAPESSIAPNNTVALTIGVLPADASNNVVVRYRVNQGPIETLTARWLRNDTISKAQYFRVQFPSFRSGDLVEYSAVCYCVGRQVPEEEEAAQFPLSFRVGNGEIGSVGDLPLLHEALPPAGPFNGGEMLNAASTLATVPPAVTRVSADMLTPVDTPTVVTKLIPLEITRPAPRSLPAIPLHELASTMPDLSPGLLASLKEREIHSLADIRTMGGLTRVEGVDTENSAVRMLDAQANLNLLSPDVNLNARLIEHGFTHIFDIANQTSKSFVADLSGILESAEAERLHSAASLQLLALENILTGIQIETQYGDEAIRQNSALFYMLGQQCKCDACTDGASPFAYLTELLKYATKHLKGPAGSIDLNWLEKRFHQPFSGFQTSCEQINQSVLQVRICIEVLRQHVQSQYRNYTRPSYLEVVYLMLLEQLGTSYDEIRQAHYSTKPDTRISLANRLMIPFDSNAVRPDRLDYVFRNTAPNPKNPQPDDLEEAWLDQFFGLRDTRRAALDPDSTPELQIWREEYLEALWAKEDQSASRPLGEHPVIDPDLLGEVNLKDTNENPTPRSSRPKSLWQPIDFLQERRYWVQATTQDLRQVQENNGLPQLLDKLQTNVFLIGKTGMEGITAPELLKYRRKQQQGGDISDWLKSVQLDQETFEVLSRVTELDDKKQIILALEWDDFYAIIVQRAKRLAFFAVWCSEEQQAGISLSPKKFESDRSSLEAGPISRTKAWRVDEAASQRWQDLLQARDEQLQTMIDNLEQAVTAVEERWLTEARNELLRLAVLPGLLDPEKMRGLTNHLQIDVQGSACQRTTRIAQAIETIQGLLFAVRNGLLGDEQLELDAPYFDQEWKWLGSYESWRSAMQAFLYPENALRGAWRRRMSAGFQSVLEKLRAEGYVNPETAHKAVNAYTDYFSDICSLSPVGRWYTNTLLGDSQRNLLAISQARHSGCLYYSAWKETFTPSNEVGTHVMWTPLPGTDTTDLLVSMFPYRRNDGQISLGLYTRGKKEAGTRSSFFSYDGNQMKPGNPIGEIPQLVLTTHITDEIPVSEVGESRGAKPWLLGPQDQIAAGDLDGDGKAEIIIVAGGTPESQGRRVALVRERDGTFVVDAFGYIPGGWQLANPERPVALGQGVLIADLTNSTLGWIVLVNGELGHRLLPRQITGPGGNWLTNLGTGQQKTRFLGMYLGSTVPSLVAFEYLPVTNQNYVKFKTRAIILSLNGFGFSLQKIQDLRLWKSNSDAEFTIVGTIVSGAWIGGTPGYGHHDLFGVTKVEWDEGRTIGAEYIIERKTEYDLQIYRWDASTTSFTVYEQDLYRGRVPADGADKPWLLGSGDKFLAYNRALLYGWNPPLSQQDLLVWNPDRGETAILSFKQGLRTVWRADGLIPPEQTGGVGVGLQTDDQLYACALEQRDIDQIVVFRLGVGGVAILKNTADGLRSESLGGGIQLPDGPLWRTRSRSSILPTDSDGDGRQELVALTGEGKEAAIGLIRGLPQPIQRSLRYWFSLWLYGPQGVTCFDLQPLPVDAQGSAAQASRSERIKESYLANAYTDINGNIQLDADGAPILIEYNTIFLDEAYYFLQMEIGMRLRESRELTAALTWFRSIYDWDAPADKRKRTYKLVINGLRQSTFQKLPNWLLDPLDPYAIAETRMGSLMRFTLLQIVGLLIEWADTEFTRAPGDWSVRARVRQLYEQALALLRSEEFGQQGQACEFQEELVVQDETTRNRIARQIPMAREAANRILTFPGLAEILQHILDNRLPDQYVPPLLINFCIPPNPAVEILRRHAELNLEKIRNCRNIAGLEMPSILPANHALSYQPLPYRYATLVERARQLVDLARQMEASMLQFIESSEKALYEEIKARQDLALTQAGVRLRGLQQQQANTGINLANLQRGRAVLQSQHYRRLIDDGLSISEEQGLQHLNAAYAMQQSSGFLKFAEGLVSGDIAEGLGAYGGSEATLAQIHFTVANFDRRQDEWYAQWRLSRQDVLVGQQQVLQAINQASIAQQELSIANLQADFAQVLLDFLIGRRLTGSPLYEWMSSVIQGVYRFFLQQATSMAQLAERQLSFERQEILPTSIQANYWEPPARGQTPDVGPTPPALLTNVRGLTGSARLLRDLYELDQYAFRTNQRKLQLIETISLAQLDPFAFQRFRETGVLPFATPMSLFDHKFPGHYLRLIRRVRTTVVALIPPSIGIRANLATTGTSQVVISGDHFDKVILQRGPEMVALSAPFNATGLFEMDVQPDLTLPFEGIGVDCTWEFQLPKASNPFDYSTIADVLITIDYTALYSEAYRHQLIQKLDRFVSSDQSFSFRNQFPDAWYDLHNPDQTSTPMKVTFETVREDFPPNLIDTDLKISQIVLYFVSGDKQPIPPLTVELLLDGKGGSGTTDKGIISTRRANGAFWVTGAAGGTSIVGEKPIGKWTLTLPDTATTRDMFCSNFDAKGNCGISDILLVITYAGRTPDWPA